MATLVRPAPKQHVAAGEEHLVPVYVWELPVRLSHWGIVAAVTVLTWTGLYMNHPFLIFHGPREWTMGTVRFIHEIAGFELIGALIVRIYWFFAGNHWARWRQFMPAHAAAVEKPQGDGSLLHLPVSASPSSRSATTLWPGSPTSSFTS